MLDYDTEAVGYDVTRGGVPRARAAAAAVLRLLPDEAGTLLDVGCGTGLVSERIVRPGLRVTGADVSSGMARMAADRLSGGVVLADSRRLPFRTASLDAVCAVWLLHLVAQAEAVIAECARVLRPGGVFIATVDKDAGHDVGSDIDELFAPFRTRQAFDEGELVLAHGARHGLRADAETSFVGHGQGRSPRAAADGIGRGVFPSALELDPGMAARLSADLAALPDQHTPRPDPVYRLLALRRVTW
ncbi:class I SAM-dependent methyltransferase [Wenjunlia tyrosinilytica]|uniref:Methyltransferase n=1 Tax=Wenjunlia tyrosinilytica TaxID=1544741 RepID=A0A918DYB4_9ACTN|nr:class I SAM-dependent methyltransferase [Wenjunlia tyrosinilytica]GGO88205.1 methyltransferase [Wenjunlia tyrosinilytica]